MAKKTATADNVTELRPKRLQVNRLSDVPAIDRYLKQIGAEAISPWTAVIKEEHGSYHQDIARIKLEDDGSIVVRQPYRKSGSEVRHPTPEEQEEIKKAVTDFDWPKLEKQPALKWDGKQWRRAGRPSDLPTEIKEADTESVFEFFNLDGQRVMYQLRIDGKDGEKRYIPWTLWSDGEWRSCEPDEPLPLWGVDQLRNHSIVWLHEGAKAARAARRIVDKDARPLPNSDADIERQADWDKHPWAEELDHAAHLGWIGGAPNPEATDWSVLATAQVRRVIIVPDNDSEGKSAIKKISRLLAPWDIEVFVVRFTGAFPASFDLADDLPVEMFEKRADGTFKYAGPRLGALVRPATWATALMPASSDEKRKPGRPKGQAYYVRPTFQRQWKVVKLESEPLFINGTFRELRYKERGFNSRVSPFSDVPVAPLLEKRAEEDLEAIAYEPGLDQVVITDQKGRLAVNTWTGSRVRPFQKPPRMTKEEFAKLAQPWTDFLTQLFPVENERKLVMRWCATLIARPRVRIRFALLLSSVMQGVGKTTLTEIMRRLVGEQNTSTIQERDIKGDHNSWMTHKRLAIAPEIYAGHSWAIYQNLKSLISDDVVRVNEKYIPQYDISQWVHFIFCSNSPVPLQIEDTDRRYFVPMVSEERPPKAYWDGLHAWLNDAGHSIIMRWAEEFVVSEGAFGPGDLAPDTLRKKRLIDDSRSHIQHLIRNLGTMMMDQPMLPVPVKWEAEKIVAAHDRARPLVVTDEATLDWLRTRLPPGERLPSLAMIRRELQAVGVSISGNRVRTGGSLVHACANFSLPDEVRGSQLTFTLPADIVAL